jgi:hypothetical protein
MFKALAWLHTQLLRLCVWLLALPFKALWSTLGAMLALLGEEAQRWAGIVVSGLLIFAAGKATLLYAPASIKKPLVLVVIVLVLVWAFAAKRAARFSMRNNLIQVRQRRAFRELKGDVSKIGGRLGDFRDGAVDTMATRARGTPFEGMIGSNRAAHRDAEADRAAAAARAAAEDDRRREELADLEPDIYAHRR